jgi:hypothetical protein
MDEILPGLYYWSAHHAPIRTRVSSYYYAPARVAIDPKIPEEGLDALPGQPEQVVLTIGLHDRDAAEFAQAFNAPIRVPRPGLHRLDEFALHLDVAEGALSFADGLINYGGLGFVRDSLLGDDAAAVKRGLTEAFRRLLDLEFDHLLFAHGEPLIGGGKNALRAFLESQP